MLRSTRHLHLVREHFWARGPGPLDVKYLKYLESVITVKCHAQIGLYWPSILNSWTGLTRPSNWLVAGCGEAYIANCLGAFFPGIWVALSWNPKRVFGKKNGLKGWHVLTVFDHANAVVQDSFPEAQNHRRSWGEFHSPHAQKIEARLGAVLVMHSYVR